MGRRVNRTEEKPGCRFCRYCQLLFGFLLLGAGGYIVWHFFGRPDANEVVDTVKDKVSDFTDVLGDWGEDINFGDLVDLDQDPFVADNSTYQWETDGKGGLELTLWNALDDAWQEEYEAAFTDWDNGDPDALSLTTKRVEVDNKCTAVKGLMKVCNGNYEETGWLGINLMTIQNGIIITDSVAKMNEYYLFNADTTKRQYTMCHEIGHGFGLAHTDENFNNKDLGNW